MIDWIFSRMTSITTLMCLVLVTVVSADSSSFLSECMDGVKDEFEECDDGNRYNSDGCSINCLLEDESTWLCNATDGKTTFCCPRLTNPWTLEDVCTCAEVDQPDPEVGFTITEACHIRDIDECNTNNGGCNERAICSNIVVTREETELTDYETHTCECGPGLAGDGIIICV